MKPATRTIPIQPEPLDPAIYARSVKGWFNTWRWVTVWLTQLLFYGLPWLSWDGRQAVLLDLGSRRFSLFWLTFTPHDLIYLALLLAISALSLFLFTAVAGRLWCGYTCPQTVYSEIFSWVERRCEGDRTERMRRDRGPRDAAWWRRKLLKHAIWLAIALWTGFTFVGYFLPIRDLAPALISGTAGAWAMFWILFYGLATYGNAGWLREKVCKYMCPYARFQGVMFDRDTLTITYDGKRGEPRGARSRHADPQALGLGDCIDCTWCVQVCPTGIDIRNGLQYECIGCAACVDACNAVMDRMAYPRGLILYGTESGLSPRHTGRTLLRRIFRPRVLAYTVIVWTLIAVFWLGVSSHQPVLAEAVRDRTVLMRDTADGGVENLYLLHLVSRSHHDLPVRISVSGLPGLTVPPDERNVTVPAQSNLTVVIHAQLAPDTLPAVGSHPIHFHVTGDDDHFQVNAVSSFLYRP